jgi:hypothetical protein
MSTPPNTETFVSGDRFHYKYSGNGWFGTIHKPHTVDGWYVCTLDEYAGGVHVLPSEHMTLVERKQTDLQKLLSRLEDDMTRYIQFMEQAAGLDGAEEVGEVENAFDQGYLAGLRKAVNLAKQQESL